MTAGVWCDYCGAQTADEYKKGWLTIRENPRDLESRPEPSHACPACAKALRPAK